MKYNQLGKTDMKVSQISLGGAAFSHLYGEHEDDKAVNFIKETLSRGINYVETSPWYGQGTSERAFGKALAGVPRNSYYIASKVGRYEKIITEMFDFSAEKTAWGVDNTLQLLGMDYVDMILIHDLTFAPDNNVLLKETLPELEKAVKDGKTRYIGLADYDIELMKEIIEESDVKIDAILSYAKSTLIDNRLQNYIQYFKNKGVAVINAAPHAMGMLTSRGPQTWHPASDDVKVMCKSAADYCKAQNVELARLANWYTFSQPGIDTHICGFYNSEQLDDALDVLENGLSPHEKKVLEEVQFRFFKGGQYFWDGVEKSEYELKLNQALKK